MDAVAAAGIRKGAREAQCGAQAQQPRRAQFEIAASGAGRQGPQSASQKLRPYRCRQ